VRGTQPTLAEVQPPQIWFVSPKNESETDRSSIEVTVKTEDMTDSLDAISFTVNQRPVDTQGTEKGKKVRPTSAKVKTHTRQIPLQVGHNWIGAQVRGKAGVAQHPKMPLKYPVKGLESVFKQQQGKAYRRVLTKIFKPAKPGDIAILFIVFASSSGADVSQEDDSWGHGAFTKALIDGLNGGAADNKGMVYIDTLRRYVSTTVQKITKKRQRPTIPRFTGSGEFFELVLAKGVQRMFNNE